MSRLSIKQRVAMWYTLFMVLTVALAFSVNYFNASRLVNDYYRTTMLSTSQLAADDIHRDNGMLEIDRNLNSLPNVRVSLFDENGALLYGRTNFDLNFEPERMRRTTDYSGNDWYAYDVLLTFEDGEDLWLRCAMPAATAGLLESSGIEMLIIMPAFVLIAALGGWLITRRAFRPVNDIVMTAKSIADGKDLQKRIALGESRDELYALAQEFNEMFDRLERSFESERRFTSDASHELRTPITAILAQADFALSEHAVESDRTDALRDIQVRAKQMSELVRRLLSLTRMDAGQTKLECENIDLTELTEIVAIQLDQEAQKRGMTIACETETPVIAYCDQTMILQAIMNLVGNSIKYGSENGHIYIAVCRVGDEIALTVKDDGPGIPENDLPMLFERFFQGDKSRHKDGAGLGLPLVRMIAELHKGRIEAANNPDAGCAFTLILPAMEDNE